MSVVDGATHEANVGRNKGSLKIGAEIVVLFLRGARLVLRSRVSSKVLDLEEVTLKYAAIFGLVPSGEGGSANGWQYCGVITIFLSCPLPLQRSHPPSLSFLCFCGMGATSTSSKG